MPALLNKRKFILSTTSFLLTALSAQAAQLYLNGSQSINITGAGYLDSLPDAQVESSAFSEEVLVHLDASAYINLDLHYGAIELLWNGLPLPVTDSDSQWLFINGLCDEPKELFVFPMPESWYLVLPDRKCEDYSDTDDLVFTILAIKHRLPASRPPKKPGGSPFSAEALNRFISSSFLDIDVMMSDESGSITSSPWLQPGLPMHPLKAEQQALLENPANLNQEITVFILNYPISQQTQKHIPGSALLNQVVTDAASEEELLTLIIQAMTHLGYVHKKVNIQGALPHFLKKIKDLDGRVNVQCVINYIKDVLRHYNPNNPALSKQNIQETIRRIIITMVGRPDGEEQQQPDQPVAGAVGGILVVHHSVPASAVPSHHVELVEQLISTLNNNVNRIVNFIFSRFPSIKNLGYRNTKERIRNPDNTINLREVLTLLQSAGDFEAVLKSELQPPPQEDARQKPRSQKTSSQGHLGKKKS